MPIVGSPARLAIVRASLSTRWKARVESALGKAGSPRTRREEVIWKDIAGLLLTKLYAFLQGPAVTISHRYFDGEEVLVPDLGRSLAGLIKYTEELVATFNAEVAGKPEDTMVLKRFDRVLARLSCSRFRISWTWPRPRP